MKLSDLGKMAGLISAGAILTGGAAKVVDLKVEAELAPIRTTVEDHQKLEERMLNELHELNTNVSELNGRLKAIERNQR